MEHNKKNLEGIVSKLKEQGINAGKEEKQKIIDSANAEAEKLISEAKAQGESIIKEAQNKAAMAEKNAKTAIAQASRDMVEATKISVFKYMKSVFGKECKTLFKQEEYLEQLLKAVIDSVSGKKSVKLAPEMMEKMEGFLIKEGLKEEVSLKPLSVSKTKIKVKCTEKEGVSLVLSSKDVEASLFSLLNKDLVDRITKAQEE